MAYDVEDKVVQMRFDNREFDPNIDASIKSLEKLEKSLQLANGTKGLENVEKSAKSFNLNPALLAVEGLQKSFSTLEVVAITAISSITNKAMAMGNKIFHAFAIDPLTSGFGEYSEQMNSTQVILSNLSDETLPSVTAALDRLNDYADRTIYSFGQMTQAIGKFAAAGVDLNQATDAIQGLSSAAATVGANNQQLFSAYYNLAQSLQLGYMQLIDWKSLENSTIGNKTMRDAFVKTAIAMGKFTEESETAQKAYSDFRGSLSDKWLTSDVIIETLGKYSKQIKEFSTEAGDAVDGFWMVDAKGNPLEPLVESIDEATGKITYYLESSSEELQDWEVELASTAFKAATEIKSFKQMWETLTEAAGTGWAETWKIIFGDLEKAKDLWTNIAKPFDEMISRINEARNEVFRLWDALGGRDDLRNTLVNIATAIGQVSRVMEQTFNKLFGTTIIEDINGVEHEISNVYIAFVRLTQILKAVSEYMLMTDEEIESTSDNLATLLSPLKMVAKAVGFVFKVVMSLVVIGVAIADVIGQIILNLALIPEFIDEIFGEGSWYDLEVIFANILSIVMNLVGLFIDLGGVIFTVFTNVVGLIKEFLAGLLGVDAESINISNFFRVLGAGLAFVANGLNNFVTWLRTALTALREFLSSNSGSIAGFFTKGLAKGLDKGAKRDVVKSATILGNTLKDTVDKTLGIESPSKEARKSGVFYGQGLVLGTEDEIPKVEEAGTDIADALSNSTNDELEKNGTPEVEINTPKFKNSQELQEYVLQSQKINNELKKAEDQSEEVSETQESLLSRIGTKLSEIWSNISNFVKNISVGQVLVIALTATIVFFIFKLTALVDDISDAIEGLGTLFKQLAFRITAEAIDQIAQALFNVAKAIALLVLVGNFDPEGMKQAVVVLGMFIAAVTLIMFLFTRLFTINQKLQSVGDAQKAIKYLAEAISRVTSLIAISIMVTALTAGVLMLSHALKELSEIDATSLWKGLGVLTLLMTVLTALVIVLSKTMGPLNLSTLFIFGYVLALKLFANSLAQIGDSVTNGIKRLASMTWQEIGALLGLIAAFTVISICLKYTSVSIAKVLLATAVLAVGVAQLIAIMGIFKNNPLAESLIAFLTDWKSVAIVCGSIAGMMVIVSISLSGLFKSLQNLGARMAYAGLTLKKLAAASLAFAGSVAIIATSLTILIAVYGSMINKLGAETAREALFTGIGIIAVVIGAVVGLTFAIYKMSAKLETIKINDQAFIKLVASLRSVIGALFEISGLMILVITAMSIFWSSYKDPKKGFLVLGSSIVMLAAVSGIIAGLMVVIERNIKGKNYAQIAIVLLPLIALIGELMIALGLFTTFKPGQLIPGIIAINAVLAPVIGLIAMIAQLGKTSTMLLPSSGFKKTTGSNARALKQIFNGVLTVLISVSILVGEVAGIAVLFNNENLTSFRSIAMALGVFATVFGLVIAGIWAMTGYVDKLSQVANPSSLIGGLGAFTSLILALTGMIAVLSVTIYKLGNIDKSGGEIAAIIGSFAAMLAVILVGVTVMMYQISQGATVIGEANGILKVLAGLAAILGALAGLSYIIKDLQFGDFALKLLWVTTILVVITRIANALSNIETMDYDIKNVVILLGNLSGIILLLAGVSYLLKDLEFGDFALKIAVLVGAVGLLGGLVTGLAALTQLDIDQGKIYAIAATIVALSTAMVSFGAMVAIFAAIDSSKVDQIVTLLKGMIVSFIALGVIAAGLGVVFNFIGGWSGVVIAFFGAMSIVLISFAAAVAIIANSPLDTITDFINNLTDDNGKLSATGKALWGLVGACTALAIGLTLGGPGILIAAVGFVALASSLYITASAIDVFVGAINNMTNVGIISDMLKSLSDGIKQILLPLLGLTVILTLLSPVIVIILAVVSLAIGVISLAFSLFVRSVSSIINSIITLITAIGNLAENFNKVGESITSFVTSLANIGNIIKDNQQSFAALGAGIASGISLLAYALIELGISALIATPGLIGIALALGVVIISIGAALALAAPLAGTIVIGIIALAVVVGLLKDSFVELFETFVGKLPQIMELLSKFTDEADAIMELAKATVILGIGMNLMGIGAIACALGIMALAGALKVVDLVLNSLNKSGDTLELFKSVIKYIIDNTKEVAKFGVCLAILGAGLIVSGVGFIVFSLGVLALAGAIAVLRNVIGTFDTIKEKIDSLELNAEKLNAIKGHIAGFAGILAVLGLGLIVLGAGCIVAGVGLLLLSGALAIMNAIGFDKLKDGLKFLIDNRGPLAGLGGCFVPLGLGLIVLGIGCGVAGLGLALLAPALILVAAAFVIFTGGLMIAAIAFTVFSNALALLVSQVTGQELIEIGIGLAMIAAGIVALAGSLLLLSIPLAIITLLAAAFIIIATVCTMLLVPAITAIALALVPAIAAVTALVQVLSLIPPEDIQQMGIALLVLAAGFAALAIAGLVVSLFIVPMQSLFIVLALVNSIIPSISNSIITFSQAINTASMNIGRAITNMADAIKEGIDTIISALDNIGNFVSEGFSAAVDFVGGFVYGITNGKVDIRKATADAGNEAIEGFRSPEGLDEHSPSKKTAESAKDFISGFVNTIKKDGSIKYACKTLGSNAIKAFKNGINLEAIKGGGIFGELGNKVKNAFGNVFGGNSKLQKMFGTLKQIWNGDFDWSSVAEKFGLNGITDAVEKATSGLGDFNTGLGDIGSTAQKTKGTLEELTDTIRNQMDIFSRFNDEDIMDPKELIHNMESQLRGIRNWSNGINILASRGASAGLIQYLSELGPQGYKYVESFLEMTEDQFAKANSLFADSLTLPDEAANTLLDGYRKSGAEIIEAVDEGITSGGGGAVSSFDSVMDDIEESSTKTKEAIVDDAIRAGELSIEAIRMAGKDAIWAYKDGVWSWFSSEDYANLTEDAKKALGEVWTGQQIMDRMTKVKEHVDISKNVTDSQYLKELAEKQGVFYIEGWGKALSAQQYIAECMKQGGQLIPAVINDEVKPEDLGELMGKTADEWFVMAMQAGQGDIVEGIQILFGDVYDDVAGDIQVFGEKLADTMWDGFSDRSRAAYQRIADETRQFYNSNLQELQSTWDSAMNSKTSDYNAKQEKQYKIQKEFQEYTKKTGDYTVQGFVNAIAAGKEKVYNAAEVLAYYANMGIKAGAKIKSPSRVTYEDGMYIVLGLVNAIEDYSYLVTNAAEDLIQNPINTLSSMSDTIQTISNAFTDDIDAEPTIRPVIDMSNVDANADKLDTLFSTQQATIAANAQVKYTNDDSIAKLKAAYADVINNANAQLVMAIQKSEQPVNVNVTLQGDASTFFKAMVDQTRQTVSTGANNPFLITNRNGINAALI